MGILDDLVDNAPPAGEPSALDRAVTQAPVARQTIGDYARKLQRGATSTFQTAPAQIASMLGAPRTAVEQSQRAEQTITERLSPAGRFVDSAPLVSEEGGLGPVPVQTVLSAAVESAPSLVQAFVAGKPIFDVLGRARVAERVAGAAQRAGVGARTAGVVGRAAEAVPFAAVEGVQAGAMAAADMGKRVRDLSDEKLRASPAFDEAYAATDPAASPESRLAAAREVIAQRAERQALAMTGASTGTIGMATGAGVIGQFARRLAGRQGAEAAADTLLKATLKGAGAEAAQETPQSGAEQLIANWIEQGLIDPNQPLTEGVLNAALTGGAAGGLLGGLGGGAGRLAQRTPEPEREPTLDEIIDSAPPAGETANPIPGTTSAFDETLTPPVDPAAGPLSAGVAAGQESGAIATNAIGGPLDPAPEPGPDEAVLAQRQAQQQEQARAQQAQREEKAADDESERLSKAAERITGALNRALTGLEQERESGNPEAIEHQQALVDLQRDRLASINERLNRLSRKAAGAETLDDADLGQRPGAARPGTDMAAAVLGGQSDDARRSDAPALPAPAGSGGAGVPAPEPSSGARDGTGDRTHQPDDAGRAGAVGQSLIPEIIDEGGADPTPPPGPRWWSDRGVMPGEPFAFLDMDEDSGSDTAIAAMREIEVPGRGVYYEVTDRDGNVLSAGSTPQEAARLAEQRLAQPKGAPAEGQAPVDIAAAQSPSSPTNNLPAPTDAQKEAGNYRKPLARIGGIDVRIENEAGTRRRPEWPKLKAHYGYVPRTEASDGDGVDVFVRPGTPDTFDGPVFVIDQVKPDGSFDEAKVMLGWDNRSGAIATYRAAYTKGWKVGPVTQLTTAEFKAWLADGDTTKPLAEKKKPPRTREEVSRERKRVYRETHPFRSFLAEHGVNTADRSDVGGERNRPVMVPYHGPLFRKTGLRLDELARRAVEAGFLTQADVDSDLDNGGVNKLSDMIRRELAGERILPVTAAESEQEAQWRADMDARYEAMQEAEDAIVEQASDDEINALLQLASDEDAEASNEEIDYIAGQERLGGETQESAAGDAPRGDSRGGAEARAESPGEVDDDLSDIPFDLDRQSDADVRQQEAQRRKDEAKAEREAAEQAKRDAAPPPEDFTLAGSDRPADEAAARGQQELAPAAPDARELAKGPVESAAPAAEAQTIPRFEVGRRVSLEIGQASLRPSKEQLQKAAKTVGVTEAEARRALATFNDPDGGRTPAARERIALNQPTTETRDGQPVGRDGLTDAERESNRLDGIADDLAMQVQQESSERDFAPSEIPAVIEQWAKDNKVDAGELRTRVVDRLRKRLSEGRMRQVEQALSEKKPAAPVAASRKPGISDFGEKIEGARKDVWASFRDKMQQASAVDIAAEPLSKSWPAPDYQALLDEGADPWAIAFMHAARDAIPTKPQKKWKVRAWVDSVRLLRNVSMGLADGRIDRARAQELLAEAEKASRGMRDIAGRIELYQLVGHSKSLAGVRITRGEYSLYNRIAYNPPKIIWTVEKQTAATAFSNWPRELASGETKEQALANFKEKFDSLEISPQAKKETTFEVYSKHGENGYWVGKKVGRNPIFLAGPFETVKEARAYKDSHNAELTDKLERSKEVPSERRDTNRPRVGEDMRGGADVTPQMFEDAFGFKGVQFGNYVEQGRRQKDLNDAYDALMDMAAILGVPPKALSLNGELGLAFGARGKGGKGAATAHYEHEQVVINLTKREGAGSLGHEWWHALDNYFSRMRSDPSGYMTEGSDVSLAAKGSDFVRPTAVRREMVLAFGEVLKAIRSTAIKARASKLDAKRTKAYWTTSPEMSARAFESFLISKLHDQGASNDYLANIVDEATWAAAEKLGFELEGSYPYPTAGEVPAIRAAFEHFFQTVETRETDSGIALHEPSARYSVHEPQRPTQQIDLPLAEGGGASSGRPGLPGPDNRARRSAVQRVEATPEVRLETTPDPAGVYLARTELVAERHRTIHADRVTNPQEAAVALASVADYAVEHFHGLVTDKAGKPLALVGMFKGAVAETRVYAETIYAEAFRVKGAANIWFTHNHPSGKAEFSAADRTMFTILRNALQGTGIEPRGFFAQTHSRGTKSPGAWVFTDNGHDTIHGQALPADIKASSQTAVPVVERVIVEQESRAAITNSAVAKDAARAMQTTLGTDAPFVMLMSAQNEPIGAYQLKPGELAILRKGERAANLFRAVSTANAGASILVDAQHALTDAELDNVAGALSVATGVRPLDALIGKNLASRMDTGGWSPPHGSFFSRREKPVSGMNAKQVESVADRVRATWANGPEVVVLGSFSDAPAAVREAEARSKGATGRPEGFFHDGTVYLVADALATPADVARVLFHEALGHYGLRGLYGNALNGVLDKVIEVRRAEVIAKMREYGLPNTLDGRRTAAEEVLAGLAQTQPKLNIVRAAIAAIRSWLRRVLPNLRVADDELVRDYIVPAREWVESGAAANVEGSAASRAPGTFWTSALEQSIAAINARAQPARQWLAQINALTTKGVKADEIEWSGIREFLALQDGRVTKEAVLDYLSENGVRVEETMLGDGRDAAALMNRALEGTGYQADFDSHTDEIVFDGPDGPVEIADLPSEVQGIVNKISREISGSARYGNYRIPGGENYRELLLTLPGASEHPKLRRFKELSRKIDMTPAEEAEYNAIGREIYPNGIPRPGEDARTRESDGFRSSHWDQPNVLAHIRFDERTDADGKRVLFINELQSDFGQALRKQKAAISKAVDTDFEGIVERMKKSGVLKVECD